MVKSYSTPQNMTKGKWNPLSNLGVFNKVFKKRRTSKKTDQTFQKESDGENGKENVCNIYFTLAPFLCTK
jgi:hypothetical protein